MGKLALKVGRDMRSKPIVVLIIWLAWVVLFVVALRLMREDYNTSVYGYQLIPTQKIDVGLPGLIGALPMLIQIAFGNWALEKGHRIAGLFAVSALIVDVYTDVTFKTGGNLFGGVTFVALAETLVLFTLCSEFLLVMSAQNIIEYLPDVIASVLVILAKFGSVIDGIGKVLGSTISWFNGDSTSVDEPTQYRARRDM